jgi:hypothetical protein
MAINLISDHWLKNIDAEGNNQWKPNKATVRATQQRQFPTIIHAPYSSCDRLPEDEV